MYDAMNPDDLAAKLSDRTRLVWVEAAGSVTMEFPDLPALVNVCRARGVMTALDNTWGAGLAFAPFDFNDSGQGVDISVHALTKYPSGGGDVLMGSVITRDRGCTSALKLTHMRMGLRHGRGRRRDARCARCRASRCAMTLTTAAAREMARWLNGCDEIAQVLHPALEDSPGHVHWRACAARPTCAAGLFSVVFDERYSAEEVDRFCDSLHLFRLGYSWAVPSAWWCPTTSA